MKHRLSRFILILIDIGIFSLAFLIAAWVNPAAIKIYMLNYWKSFSLFIVIWTTVSLLSDKYKTFKERRFSLIVSSIISTAFISTSIIVILIFTFKAFHYSRFVVLGPPLFATLIEIQISWAYYYSRKFILQNPDFSETGLITRSNILEDGEIDTESEYLQISESLYSPSFLREKDFVSIKYQLKNRHLVNGSLLFEFLDSSINLSALSQNKSEILKSSTLFNISRNDSDSLEFFLNLHPLNDFRRINEYFIEVNRILKNGGVFTSCGQTLEERRRGIKKKYNKLLSYPVLFFDFVFNRVFPKLDILKGIYFSITKGKNRPISRCEILGRLHYCGFQVIATKEINDLFYFIAVKVKKPSDNPDPSYGPLYKKRAIGKNEQYIYVYKFRTMHPYAEYVHDYMLRYYGYSEIGKPANDFRVTRWGKWMRHLWLDELPQLFNVLKGEMKLVGIRPITKTFLNEFPDDIRRLRAKHKPGCIPAYVSLLKQSKDGFIEAETIYLLEKEKHPVWTDVKYLCKAVYNISTNKIRSE